MIKEIEYYTTLDGKCPYIDWFKTLSRDYQSKVIKRINRLEDGLLGDCKRLTGSKLSELRPDFGKGYYNLTDRIKKRDLRISSMLFRFKAFPQV